MTLRLHFVVAALLFPALIVAQTSSTAGKPQSKPAAVQTPGGPYAPMSTRAEQRAVQFFELFVNGQPSAVWAMFAEGTKKNYGSQEKFNAKLKELRDHLGTEKKKLDDNFTPHLSKPWTNYSRLSLFSKGDVEVISHIAVNERGEVEVFQIGPERNPYQGHFGGYKDVTKLKLPFSGEWFVYQGGRSAFQNANFLNEDQRFSLDFVLMKDGRIFSGDGTDITQYYCFGQPILAPADGLVVDVQDGYQDNPPGRPAMDSPHGNEILISHGNSEFSMMDHLKQNSIRFKKGDKVKQGDVVAECGNSGPSPIPRIHYQLQNSAGLPLPDSLPAQFVDYMADGKLVEAGEPERGQIVSNAPPGSAQPAGNGQTTSKNPPGNK